MDFIKRLFFQRDIEEEHHKLLVEEIAKLTGVLKESQENNTKEIKNLKSEISNLNQKIDNFSTKMTEMEALYQKNIDSIFAKLDLVSTFVKSIWKDESHTTTIIRNTEKIISLIENIQSQINLIPKDVLDLEHMPKEKKEHFLYYIKLTDEVKKTIEEAKTALAKDIEAIVDKNGEKLYDKYQNNIYKNLTILNNNFEIALENAISGVNSEVKNFREYQRSINQLQEHKMEKLKNSLRNPASRNSYFD